MPRRILSVFDWRTGRFHYYAAPEDYYLGEEPRAPLRIAPPPVLGEHIEDLLVTVPLSARYLGDGDQLLGEAARLSSAHSMWADVMGALGL